LNQVLQPVWNHPSMPVVEQHGASYWIEIKR
jgi:hypothetical protein